MEGNQKENINPVSITLGIDPQGRKIALLFTHKIELVEMSFEQAEQMCEKIMEAVRPRLIITGNGGEA